MARSRYAKNAVIEGRAYESFTLDQTNSIAEPDTFKDVRTRTYTVSAGERIDHIAARFLNEDRYWWMIALVNNFTSPFLTPGQKILVPVDAQDILDRL